MHMTSDKIACRWEARLGFLLGARIIVDSAAGLGVVEGLRGDLSAAAVSLLGDDEGRVRDSAGQLLGSMCGRLGTAVYEEVRAPVLELIRSNLERSEEVSRKGR